MRVFSLLLCLALLAVPAIGAACGYSPWSDEAEPLATATTSLLQGERLPLLSPNWRSEYWVAAWARLEGKQFSDGEVAALTPGWLAPESRVDAAVERWKEARAEVVSSAVRIRPRRQGDHYSYRLICGPDAFDTAVATLNDRRASYAEAELRRWLERQDRVFAACEEPSAPAPAPAAPSATPDEQFDAQYQHAVWAEYTEAADALPEYEAIASTYSPWAGIALYRAARMRVGRNAIGVAELRTMQARAQSAKVSRALRQLIDRVELFQRPPEAIVQELGARLLREDLGADLPRTLRDIVWFAKRAENPCVDDLTAVVACRQWEVAPNSLLARLRRTNPNASTLAEASRHELLAMTVLLHQTIDAVEADERVRARTLAHRMLRLARGSTAASRNAASALVLATAPPSQARRYLTREALRTTTLHADGRRYLASRTMNEWDRIARDERALRPLLRRHAFVRAALLGQTGRATRYARQIAASDDDFGQALAAVLRSRANRRFAYLLAIAQHDPTEFSVAREFQTQYGTTQESSCEYGACRDAHPNQTALSHVPGATRTMSAERVRLGLSRIEALGDAVLAWVRTHRDHPGNAELLHHYVQRTRRASIRGTGGPRLGELSRAAFRHLHQHHAGDPWTEQTRHWYQ